MNETYDAAAIFKSLGDETRLSIVRKLAREQKEVNSHDIISDCAIALKLSQPTMSHHFQTLVSASVLSERKVGVEKFYQLNVELLEQVGIDSRKV
ncbi:MAG TPA: metalloregulator ArsR/SmtB family transcription factor [Candidatus Saccharimonadales bacterium]